MIPFGANVSLILLRICIRIGSPDQELCFCITNPMFAWDLSANLIAREYTGRTLSYVASMARSIPVHWVHRRKREDGYRNWCWMIGALSTLSVPGRSLSAWIQRQLGSGLSWSLDDSDGALQVWKRNKQWDSHGWKRKQPQNGPCYDPKSPFWPHYQVSNAVAGWVLGNVGSCLDDLPVRKDDFQCSDIISSDTVLDCPHPACIGTYITADCSTLYEGSYEDRNCWLLIIFCWKPAIPFRWNPAVLYRCWHQVAFADKPALAETLLGREAKRTQRIRILMDIDPNVNYSIHVVTSICMR